MAYFFVPVSTVTWSSSTAKGGRMRKATPILVFLFVLLCGLFSPIHAQSAGVEWDALQKKAQELCNSGKYDRALLVAQKALQVAEKRVGPNHPSVAYSLSVLGDIYASQGNYDSAEALYKRALAVTEKLLGPDHPDVAYCLNNLGLLYKIRGDYDSAEPLHKRALAIYKRVIVKCCG